VHDPGRNDLNAKDSASHDDGDSSTSNGNMPYTANTHLSHDCNRNETISTASTIKPILDFVQGNTLTPMTPNRT